MPFLCTGGSMRNRFSPGILGLLALAASLTLGADKSSTTGAQKPKATPPPAATSATNSCKTCVERRPILAPSLFADTRIYDREARPGYEIAQQIPATIDRLHCFCECAESPHFRHKTLLTCFTDNHAAGCGICLREALMAAELKQKGASDEEVVMLVESAFKTDGHPPTHGATR
jgi:Protein of unknown function with PCYCGC motif